MSPEQFNFLVNAGVAGLFAVFAIMLFDRFIKFIDNQTVKWQAFLEAEREEREKNTQRYTEQLKTLAEETAKISALMVVHDQRVQAAIPGMQAAIEREKSRPIRRGGS